MFAQLLTLYLYSRALTAYCSLFTAYCSLFTVQRLVNQCWACTPFLVLAIATCAKFVIFAPPHHHAKMSSTVKFQHMLHFQEQCVTRSLILFVHMVSDPQAAESVFYVLHLKSICCEEIKRKQFCFFTKPLFR